MLVSIIIPCYNVEEFIAECIDSALAQSYGQTEIICVDNNSTDKTPEILKDYASRFPDKIQVLIQTKQGAPAARNLGISVAKGEWFQFLDADDLLLPEKISEQVRRIKLEKERPDVVIGGILKKFVNGETHHFEVKTDNIWKALVLARAGCTCSNLYRKEFLAQAGNWDESRKSSQEAFLLFTLLKNNCRILYVLDDHTLVRERKEGSISVSLREDNWDRYIGLRMDILDYLKKNNKLDAETEKAIHQSVFDTIRTIYPKNPERAIALHDSLVKKKFIPVASAATSGRYISLYKLLGFSATQKLLTLVK